MLWICTYNQDLSTYSLMIWTPEQKYGNLQEILLNKPKLEYTSL